MRTIEEILEELRAATAEQSKPVTPHSVAKFQLDVEVFSNGLVNIGSPQNPKQQEAPKIEDFDGKSISEYTEALQAWDANSKGFDPAKLLDDAKELHKKLKRPQSARQRRYVNGALVDPIYERYGQKVSIDGTEYISVQDAARGTGVHPYQIKNRCASKSWPTWFIIED